MEGKITDLEVILPCPHWRHRPTSTDDALRERVEALERDVFAALKPYQEPSTRDLRNDPVSRKRRVSERERWFERVRDEILEHRA